MAPRARKHDPTIPGHIDQSKIPQGVYWDRSGRGRWYVFEREGLLKKKRRTIAGPKTLLSELHAMVEQDGNDGTVEALSKAYHSSAKFKKLAKTTQADYEYSRDVLLNFPAAAPAGKVGKLQASRLVPHHFQRMVDKLDDDGTPTKANKLLRYARLLFRWGVRRGLLKTNPVQGVEQAKERQQRRLPASDAYMAVLAFAKERGARKAHTEGSVAPYLWIVMELGYLCRLRGVEVLTTVEAQGELEGYRTRRRKGSRDSLVKWTPRLRAAWNAALDYRKAIVAATTRIQQLRPEDRRLFLAQGGEPLSRSGLSSAWQRMIVLAIRKGVISEEQRFSGHDLKRKGGTDAPGNRGDRQDALGVTDAMMKVYDHSVPAVEPSEKAR